MSDLDGDIEKVARNIEMFKEEKMYYLAILMKNNEGKSPLDIALEMNSARYNELFLNSLTQIPEFNLSRLLYKKFGHLFKLKIKSFEQYLGTCYFTTPQMMSLTKVFLNTEE